MNIILKKTNVLSIKEKKEICELFKNVFFKEMSLKEFEKKFSTNPLFYSYHSLLINDENEIVGCYSSIPYQYCFNGNKVLFGLSVDTMIHSEYRGSVLNFKKLAKCVYASMKDDGISFVFGFPNDNAYLLRKKVLKWNDIGRLDFYMLPIKISAIKPNLKLLDFTTKLFAFFSNSLLSSKYSDESNYVVEKNNNVEFINSRYDESYNIMTNRNNGHFCYKIFNEDGVKAGYLVDVYPLNKNNIEDAVNIIYKQEKNNVDLILYVGKLNFPVRNLIKVPERFHPKEVLMSGLILNHEYIDDKVFDISNWNVNLSNYDVR